MRIHWLPLVALAGTALAQPASRFGHHQYSEARKATLASAGNYRDTGRTVLMRVQAADAFKEMVKAAREDGVQIIPISGFRSISYQKTLFKKAKKRHGSAREAARWVAPPGFSEHATGWTLDLGDAKQPKTDVEQSFDGTKAFQWLTQNAASYNYEISFPKNNPQGVSYEPWHWRYVGVREAQVLFHPIN